MGQACDCNATFVGSISTQGKKQQVEHSVKTFRSPLFTEFWMHCVLSGGSQLRALPRHQKGIESIAFTVTFCAPAPRLASEKK